ncbi:MULTISPECIES: SulP family inorganic anion transporter [unclassified Bradyrhizobium]|uniref:SLC26A/SulP transporter family protein n=1 Tax=unclassified Bradyrhizobium TaxID=2631580 RepID=UPI00247AC5B1|nr:MULTISPECIES: SulP family inorganic anion transporter [unclassified Bradyrhizobium]WGR71406.1 SulP family inorganic anion transporter [Bradyrhizobium sp. ISRA426]WGR76241.1 SulP family inorganic anion transporter [Bradyrhizobium sp. ISRA430]WGR86646.1 SulP family inorganic anion transporter [Bradyrhizobium sp. ISRA432]
MTDPAITYSPAPRFSPALKRALNDILGGSAASVLTVTFGLSYALLIFAGPLSPYLSYGIAATFISSAVLAAVVAFGSSLPFAVAAPDSSTAAVTGILAASLVERIDAANPSTPLLSPVLITLGLSTILTGVTLCGLGLTRMGRAIRYVPYPVVGGFLGATGLLIVMGAIRVITGHPVQLGTLLHFTSGITLSELGAACAMALVLYLTWHRSRGPFGLPVILIGGMLTAHVAFWIAGVSPEEARSLGWTFQPPPPASFMLPWHADDLVHYPWFAVPDLLGNLVAVIFVTASSTLFGTTGIEVAVHREANLERELNVTGAANILTGALAGYGGCISVSRSILNFSSGGRGRLSGLTVAAMSLLMLAVAPELLGFMPKFVLGGLLIYLGADQLHKWIIESRKRLSKLEYLSLIAIIVIIVTWGFVPGILIGVIIGCATFAFSAARVETIKYSFDGSEYRSSLDRSRDDHEVLLAHGGKIQGLNLQSYLFFGSANRLYQRVKKLLQERPECRYLLFDFKLVTGVDSSAAYSFAQIKRSARDLGVELILVHLSAAAEKVLRSSDFIGEGVIIIPELDHALEWCENELIAQHQGLAQEEASLRDWFMRILKSEHDADELIRRCQRLDVEAGEVIVNAGDPADSMHFILDGRVGIMVPAEEDRTTRVRSLGRYTTIGEMGLVAHTPRSATIQAEVASVLYVLNTHQFNAIRVEDPELSHKLLTYFVSVMAERLSFANRTIAVLRR